jgi:hypothetical protein
LGILRLCCGGGNQVGQPGQDVVAHAIDLHAQRQCKPRGRGFVISLGLQRHGQRVGVGNPATQRGIEGDFKTCLAQHPKTVVGPVHPVVLRALTGNAEQPVVGGQQAQVHQALDGSQLGLRIALQQHLTAVGRSHQHAELLPDPPTHMALVVKPQLRGDEAQVRHVLRRNGRKVQARHGLDTLHPRERTQHRRQRQHAAQTAGNLGLVPLQRRGAQRGRLEQQGQLRSAEAIGLDRATDAVDGIQIQAAGC